MCKSQTTYGKGSTSDSQTGILNIWFSSEGVPWVFVGAAAVLFLWCLLTSHSCLKKRKAHRNLQATNLALSNHRMGQSIISAPAQPEIPSIIAGLPPAYGISQPFLPPSAPSPLANSSPVDPNYRVMSLTYNKPFTSWGWMAYLANRRMKERFDHSLPQMHSNQWWIVHSFFSMSVILWKLWQTQQKFNTKILV